MLDLSELPEEPDPSLPHALPVSAHDPSIDDLAAVDVQRDPEVERFLASPTALTIEEILALLPE